MFGITHLADSHGNVRIIYRAGQVTHADGLSLAHQAGFDGPEGAGGNTRTAADAGIGIPFNHPGEIAGMAVADVGGLEKRHPFGFMEHHLRTTFPPGLGIQRKGKTRILRRILILSDLNFGFRVYWIHCCTSR